MVALQKLIQLPLDVAHKSYHHSPQIWRLSIGQQM